MAEVAPPPPRESLCGSDSRMPLVELRRVVVTGLGVVSPNGHDREAFRRANRDGISGVHRIEEFDTSRLRSRVAGVDPGGRPDPGDGAAAIEAGQPDGPAGDPRRARGAGRRGAGPRGARPGDAPADRRPARHGRGRGGIHRGDVRPLLCGEARAGQRLRPPGRHARQQLVRDLDRARPARAVARHLDRVHLEHRRDRLRLPPHPVWRVSPGRDRRRRRPDRPGDHDGLRPDEDHGLGVERRADARQPAVQPRPRRLRPRRGGLDARARGARARPGPGGRDLRRGPRLRQHLRRLASRGALGRPRRAGPRHRAGAARRRGPPRAARLRQPARHGHRAERPRGDRRGEAGPGRVRGHDPDVDAPRA